MSQLEDLHRQKKEIERRIREASQAERKDALKTVKQLVRRHRFTESMLKSVFAPGRKRRS